MHIILSNSEVEYIEEWRTILSGRYEKHSWATQKQIMYGFFKLTFS